MQIADQDPIPTVQVADADAASSVITPDSPPWNLVTGFLVWVASVAAIFVFPLLVVIPYFLITREAMPDDPSNDSRVILLSLIGVIPAHIFTLIVAWPVVTGGRGLDPKKTLGFNFGAVRWWMLPLVAAAFFALAYGVTAIFPEQDNDVLRIIRSSRTAAVVFAFVATFFAPVVEEVVYRGILYSALLKKAGTTVAVILVTLMFAGIHYPQYWGSPGSIILITLLSLILTLTRTVSGNLLPCIVLHLIFNGVQAVSIIAAVISGEDISAPVDSLQGLFR